MLRAAVTRVGDRQPLLLYLHGNALTYTTDKSLTLSQFHKLLHVEICHRHGMRRVEYIHRGSVGAKRNRSRVAESFLEGPLYVHAYFFLFC